MVMKALSVGDGGEAVVAVVKVLAGGDGGFSGEMTAARSPW